MVFMEGYEIVRYNHEFLDGTLKILKDTMWSKRFNAHEKHFKWKYQNNPYATRPLGIVTLCNNNVVGFRGYFATQWQANGKDLLALAAGDTVVDRAHRRKGLSIVMGNKACDVYASYYKFFINMEATPNAVPGYLKLGFVPILDKRVRMSSFKNVNTNYTDLLGNVEVLAKPKPKEMYNAVTLTDKISLKQDAEFFKWRFKSKIPNTYLFYYYKRDYMVVAHLRNHDAGYIIDYTENDIEAFEIILKRIMVTKFLNMIYIRDINLSKNVLPVLKKYKFADNNLKNKSLCPILVRPVKKDFVESDWFVNGLDMRDINNWKLKGICSEWA